MQRWAISDYSDNEEEEYQRKQNQNANQEDIEPFSIDENCNQNKIKNIKNKKRIDLNNLLDNVLQNINHNYLKKSHDEFVKLKKEYKNQIKMFFQNKAPKFFIYKLFQITKKVNEISQSIKSIRKLQKDIIKFNQKFEKELTECQQNPEKFIIDDYDFEEEEEEVKEKSMNNDWFLPSDDEEKSMDKNAKLYKNQSKKTSKNESNNQQNNKSCELNHKENSLIIDERIKKELTKYSLSRLKGKIITNINRLYELYESSNDEDLSHNLLLEICFTIEKIKNDQEISFETWSLIHNILPNLVDDAKNLVPFFERLNQDLWTHSFKNHKNITQDITRFYEILTHFIDIIKVYKEKLKDEKEFALFLRLEIMSIGHIFYKDNVDLKQYILNMEDILNKKVFNEQITNDFKTKFLLFQSFNLAVRKLPQLAYNILNSIPNISSIMDSTNQVLFYRTITEIGVASFNDGQFNLTLKCFYKLGNIKDVDTKLDQKSFIYQPFISIDAKTIKSIQIFSRIFNNFESISDETDCQYKIANFIEKKRTSFEEYIIISKMVNYIRGGEWENANTFVINRVGSIIIDQVSFLVNLKKICLCYFLSSIKENEIKLDHLAKKFELPNTIILDTINKMANKLGTFESSSAEYKYELSNDMTVLKIKDQSISGLFSRYNERIELKLQNMETALKNLI